MSEYFDLNKSIEKKSCGNISKTLETIALRYISANPKAAYTVRPFISGSIARNKDYRYRVDCSNLFPDAKDGSYVYFSGKYFSSADSSLTFKLIPFGPVKVYMNGKEIYGTTFKDERYLENPVVFEIPVKKGWNHLTVRCTKTKAGFGGEWGTWLGKLDYYFLHEDEKLSFIEGFDYTLPLEKPLKKLPVSHELFVKNPVSENCGVLKRVFSDCQSYKGKTFLARTCLKNEKEEIVPLNLGFSSSVDFKLYIDGENIGENIKSLDVSIKKGIHQILLVIKITDESDFDFAEVPFTVKKDGQCLFNPLFTEEKDKKSRIVNPGIKNPGVTNPWIYAGPFEKSSLQKLLNFSPYSLVGQGKEKTYWRMDFEKIPEVWLRLYNDNPLFGHWNYPLGVTLYGLIETARYFEQPANELTNANVNPTTKTNASEIRTENTTAKEKIGSKIREYVKAHIARSVSTFDYAMFDKNHFTGATAVHHLLTSIDSLDDCGSFASTMLEVCKDSDFGSSASDNFSAKYKKIAEFVGDYICKKQSRLSDGSLYRKQMMHEFHNGTMWADDLYMSIPFLCRFSALEKNPEILDDAVRQFKGFKKRLYMDDKKLMAHVYDFTRDMNTGIPWGRGNGWTIFSLTELLSVLPENHPERNWLLDFYNDFARGILEVQDKSGMWHQVLDMQESYIETSCTAMFICAFSRGIRNGWIKDKDAVSSYFESCKKAWKALEKYAIDFEGNVWGVCRGSEFAFSPKYYAEHLLPRLNDTHGIGIVLLAGVELERLLSFSLPS